MLSIKSKIVVVVLALFLGVAMAWIQPARPVQEQAVAQKNPFTQTDLLDNDSVVLDGNIHNSRKCKYCPI